MNGPITAADWLTAERTPLPWRYDIDVKLIVPMQWNKLRFEPFVEIHHLFDERYNAPGEGGLDFSKPLSNFSSQISKADFREDHVAIECGISISPFSLTFPLHNAP